MATSVVVEGLFVLIIFIYAVLEVISFVSTPKEEPVGDCVAAVVFSAPSLDISDTN